MNPDTKFSFVISADSTLDLPPELIEKYRISIIPSYVNFGEVSKPDYPDLAQNNLFDFYDSTGTLAATAAANQLDYYEHFSSLLNSANAVIHISKSSGISSCYNNAVLAAKDLPCVYVVDSLNLSSGSGLLVREAAECGSEDPEEIYHHLLEFRNRLDSSFLIETLTYLREGGRCSTLAAFGANLLKLRPQIVVSGGVMHPAKKYRGSFDNCVLSYINDILRDIRQYDDRCIAIAHTLCSEDLLNTAKAEIESKQFFKEIIVCPASAGIACHCGPNTFGLFLVSKEKSETER